MTERPSDPANDDGNAERLWDELAAEDHRDLIGALFIVRDLADVALLSEIGLVAAHASAPAELRALVPEHKLVVLVDTLDGAALRAHLVELNETCAVWEMPLPPATSSISGMLGHDVTGRTIWDAAATTLARQTWIDWCLGHAVVARTGSSDGVEPFPVSALPRVLQQLVTEGAESHRVDAAFFGVPMLGILAGCIGNSRRVQVRGRWSERCILWSCVVAGSGSGKSPALDVLVAPVREVDEEMVRRSAAAHEQYKVALAEWQRQQRRKDAGDTGAPPEPPPTLCCLVDDVTMEALAVRLRDNPHGLILATDEASTWLLSHDAYRGGRGGDEARWLALYGGRPIKVDRKAGGTIYIPSPHVSIAGGIQPRVAERVLGRAQRESGLAARLLLAAPPTRPSFWSETTISDATLAAYRSVVHALLDLQKHEPPLVMSLTGDACALFRQEYDRLGAVIATADRAGDDDLAAVAAKLRSAIPRMALVLALARAAQGGVAELLRSIDAQAMAGAIALGAYFEAHARAIYASWRATRDSPVVAKVLAAIREAGEAGATKTMIHAKLGRNVDAELIDAALRVLHEQGLVEPVERTVGAIGRPAERWKTAR